MKTKNLPLYGFIIVITLFSIGYFIGVYNISFAFPTGNDTTLYDNKIKQINLAAKLYGENNLSEFDTTNPLYITVDELIQKGYLYADNEEGDFKNPDSEVLTFNDLKVRVEKKGENIETKILD